MLCSLTADENAAVSSLTMFVFISMLLIQKAVVVFLSPSPRCWTPGLSLDFWSGLFPLSSPLPPATPKVWLFRSNLSNIWNMSMLTTLSNKPFNQFPWKRKDISWNPLTDLLGFLLTGDKCGHVTTINLLLPYLTLDVTLIRQLEKCTSMLLCDSTPQKDILAVM